jgi:hypothetical protein
MNIEKTKGIGRGKHPNSRNTGNAGLYERVQYLLDTKINFDTTHKDVLERLKKAEFTCPMGWVSGVLLTPEEIKTWREEHADRTTAA